MTTTAQVKKFSFSKSGETNGYELKTVKVGDYVCFKSDHEQSGRITKIETRRDWQGERTTLTLHDPNGFGGEYLRYAKTTTEDASDCWI